MSTGSNREGLSRAAGDLERYFAQSADMLCIAGDDGYFKYVNAAWERNFGWTVEEMTTHPWSWFVHPDDLERTIEEATGQLERGLHAIAFDNRYRAKDGRYIWLRWNSRPNAMHGEMHAMARDISAEKDAELALEAANEALAHSNAELRAFTYSASHDLREPLRSMATFGQMLLEDYGDKLDGDGRDYLNRIVVASARMKQLLDDLMTISRVTSANMPPAVVSVESIVAEFVDSISVTIAERNAMVDVQSGLPDVLADPSRVRQIFANLISNAIKFNTGGAPRVEVGWGVDDAGETVFFVRDNGIGIDEEHHEKIFGIFQRLHRREEFEGTGAGLAIVKRAVEVLGGRIWLESSPGAGSTFHFTLPVAPRGARTAVLDAAA